MINDLSLHFLRFPGVFMDAMLATQHSVPTYSNYITIFPGLTEFLFFLDYDMKFTQCYSSRLTISRTTDVYDLI
jgi:hypothetical protein